jgi:hypothetical protein
MFAGFQTFGLDRPAQKRHIKSPCQQSGDRLKSILAMQDQTQMRQACRNQWA